LAKWSKSFDLSVPTITNQKPKTILNPEMAQKKKSASCVAAKLKKNDLARTAPPSVCVPDVNGALVVWIQQQKHLECFWTVVFLW